jgi:5-methylcytosine-specific restriction endonuclease McrA
MAYDAQKRSAYYAKNADRIKSYQRAWRQKRRLTHPEEAVRNNERVKRYQQTKHGRAALKAGLLNTTARKRGQAGKITAADVLSLERICRTCGKQDELQIDHITPAMHGGLNVGSNLQMLCVDCHKAKTAKERSMRVDVSTVPQKQLRLL